MPQSLQGEDETAGKAPRALARALVLLTRKSRSGAMLRRLLAAEGFSEGEIDAALQRAQAYGYVHDGRLAESVGHAAWRRGKGPAWVQRALAERAIDPAAAQAVMGEASAQEQENATQTLLRRASRLPSPTCPRARARAMRFLLSRGFSPQASHRACQVWAKTEAPGL